MCYTSLFPICDCWKGPKLLFYYFRLELFKSSKQLLLTHLMLFCRSTSNIQGGSLEFFSKSSQSQCYFLGLRKLNQMTYFFT